MNEFTHIYALKRMEVTQIPLYVLIQWIELYSGESCIQLGFSSLPPHPSEVTVKNTLGVHTGEIITVFM
jgi:hypothetical protein